LDFVSSKDAAGPDGVADFFAGIDAQSGDALIAFGWAMAEDLDKLSP
jgi:hypothetical protein